MALAGRSSRRGGGRRWIVVGLVLTLLVLLVDASVKSRSPSPVRTLTGQAWYDRVQPLVQASTASGRQLGALRSATSTVSAAGLQSDLGDIVSGSAATLSSYQKLRPPPALSGSAGLLQTVLLVRAQAASSLASAVRQQLARPIGASLSAATTAIIRSGQELQVADEAYRLFASGLPSWVGVRPPPSVWVTDTTAFGSSGLSVWLAALRSRISLAPVHRVAIVAVSTDPAPITHHGSVTVLTPSTRLVVTVVVGDIGNQPESDLTVTAALSQVTPGGSSSVRTFVDLAPGGAHAITFDPLAPPIGVQVELTVTITPPAGSTTPAEREQLSLLMPSSTSATTSTTTPKTSVTGKGTATTLPGSATSGTTTTTLPGG